MSSCRKGVLYGFCSGVGGIELLWLRVEGLETKGFGVFRGLGSLQLS